MDANGKASMNGEIVMVENKLYSGEVVVNIYGGDGKSKDIVDSPPGTKVDSYHDMDQFNLSHNRPSKIPNSETLTRRKSPTGAAPSVDQNPDPPLKKISTMASFGVEKAKLIFEMVTLKKELKKKRSKIKVLVEWVAFLSILGGLVASLTVDHVKHLRLWSLEIWKWFVLVMVVVCGMTFTSWLMHFIVLVIELNFLLKKKVMYFVHGLKKSVQVFIWLILVLATWLSLFNNGKFHRSSFATKVLDYITWTIVSLLIGSFLWLVKTFLLKILAESFHGSNFFDRIQESIFHQYIIQTLSGPAIMESVGRSGGGPTSSRWLSFWSRKKGKEGKATKATDVNALHQMKQEKVTAWTMKMLVDSISNSGLSTLSSTIEEDAYDEQADNKETTNEEATAAAYKIFTNVTRTAQTDYCNCYIEESHLMRFMIKEEVAIVFPLIDVAKTGKIDMKALTEWVLKVFNGRKDLAQALDDTKTAVRQLNKIVIAILIVIMTVVWLLLTGIANTKVLLFLSSQLVVAAFIFGNTCKTIFEAIIFVFFMHPFDVGDRCVVDGVQLIVKEMNILNTVFLRYDNEKIYYPNSVLSTKPISNFFRSPEMWDSLEFSIDFKTPTEKINLLKEKMKEYLEKNPQFWLPDHMVAVKEIENLNNIKMAFYFSHTINFQESGEKIKRKTELVLEMKKIFEDLNLEYNLLPQPIHLNPQPHDHKLN